MSLAAALTAAVSPDGVQQGSAAATGFPTWWPAEPSLAASPATEAEACAAIASCAAAGAAVVPCGGATRQSFGYAPRTDRPLVALRTSRMASIVDWQPDDMTVTVQAGITLAALQETLASRRQYLPLDPPWPERATVGGIVSAAAAGFSHATAGNPRDLVIGVRAVQGDGTAVKGGGRVVKNVAGYDLCKLFTGAWGSAGFLTEVTFRLYTLPDERRVLAWQAPSLAAAVRAGAAMHGAMIALGWIVATNVGGTPQLIAAMEGPADRVAWQAAECARIASEAGLDAPPAPANDDALRAVREADSLAAPDGGPGVRAACLPTDLPGVAADADAQGYPAVLHVASGLVSIGGEAAARHGAGLPAGAEILAVRLDDAHDDGVRRWGERDDGVGALHRRAKEAADPASRFNPGRFYGRL